MLELKKDFWIQKNVFLNKLHKALSEFNDHLIHYLINQSEENVHDVRVWTRRIEVASQILPKKIRKCPPLSDYLHQLKQLFKMNAKIRDFDIICRKLVLNNDEYSPEIYHRLKNARFDLVDQAVQFAIGLQSKKIIIDQSLNIDKLNNRLRKVIDTFKKRLDMRKELVFADETKIKELHHLRKDCKILRYSLELVSTDEPVFEYLQYLKNLQEKLGDIHDSDVLINYLSDFKDKRAFQTVLEKEIKIRKQKFHCLSNSQ